MAGYSCTIDNSDTAVSGDYTGRYFTVLEWKLDPDEESYTLRDNKTGERIEIERLFALHSKANQDDLLKSLRAEGIFPYGNLPNSFEFFTDTSFEAENGALYRLNTLQAVGGNYYLRINEVKPSEKEKVEAFPKTLVVPSLAYLESQEKVTKDEQKN